MRVLALGLALLLVAGCQGRVFSPFATPSKVEERFESPEPLLEALAQRRALLTDLKARARFTLRTPEQELAADHAVVFSGESSLRLESLSPLGQPTALLVAHGGHLRWVDPVGGRYWDGPASEEVLERLIGVPLAPKEMVAILAGSIPPGAVAVGPYLDDESGGAAYRFSLSTGQEVEEVEVASRDLTVLSRRRYDADGHEVLRVSFGNFRDFDDYPLPLLVEVALPERDYRLKVEYQKVLANQSVEEGIFDLPIPPGSRRIHLP